MVKTASTMLPLGSPMPRFALPNATDGRIVSSSDFSGAHGVLVAFICNHCPFVVHIRKEFIAFAREFQKRGLAVVAVSSNDLESYPQDGPAMMRVDVGRFGYPFPYLFDGNQSAAKAFQAACTPDFFLFDHTGRLAYRGQFDDSRPGSNIPVTGRDLRGACAAVLARQPVSAQQFPSLGCNIKWKAGHEPVYFTGKPAA